MPQLDPSVFPTQLFWLVVTFVPLYLILWKKVLPRIGEVLAARQAHIDADLERAASLKEEAAKVLAEYEKTLAETRGKANALIKEASEAMAAESAERQRRFAAEMAEKTREAEQRIAAAKDAALAELTTVAVEVAGAATQKLLGSRPSGDQVRQAVEAAMGGGR